jgi:hypothetical protein
MQTDKNLIRGIVLEKRYPSRTTFNHLQRLGLARNGDEMGGKNLLDSERS